MLYTRTTEKLVTNCTNNKKNTYVISNDYQKKYNMLRQRILFRT